MNLLPGDVEGIVWQSTETDKNAILANELLLETPKIKSRIKAFDGLFENATPIPPDFNLDQAKWEFSNRLALSIAIAW